jgi:hypothetical protein
MALISYKLGQGSIILRMKLLNSSVATGAGLTGLTYQSTGLIVSTIADNETSATVYAVAAGNVETIATLGTFAAPTAGKCRLKEVDATNHKGVYEIHIADARFNVANAKSLLVSVSGATNAAETDVVIPLTQNDPYDGVRGGLTALPNAAAGADGGLPVLALVGTELTVAGVAAAILATPAHKLSSNQDGSVSACLTGAANAYIVGFYDGTAQWAIPQNKAGRMGAAFQHLLDVDTPAFTAESINQTGDAPTAEQIADALLDRTNAIEANTTLRQALRIVAAVLAGKVTGAGTGAETFKGLDGLTTRVVVATDSVGNRLNVTYTPN